MNKYQDALSRIISFMNEQGCAGIFSNYYDGSAEDVLMELVDKAAPNKVEKNIEGASYCPNCKVVVANKNIINDLNYCHYCGQAIDWSDENVE